MEKDNRLLRSSNIELLRIIAMFLVLVVHADFLSLGSPTSSELQISPLSSYTRFFIESLSIICVNVFILISGWFGIRPSAKSFLRFVFQCLFFLIGIYIVSILIGNNTLNLQGIANCSFRINWFIIAYVCLYILAPVLNAFIKIADKRKIKIFLILFFTFQTIYGWLGTQLFTSGYSTLSFIGLYILGRYLNLYSEVKHYPPHVYILIYLVFSLTTTALAIIFYPGLLNKISYSYVSPFVIIASAAMLLAFVNMRISHNKYINWVAASSFAIFLLHIDSNIINDVFINGVKRIYESTEGVICLLYIGVFLSFVAVVAILIDQIRIIFWNLFYQIMERISIKYNIVYKIWNYKSSII